MILGLGTDDPVVIHAVHSTFRDRWPDVEVIVHPGVGTVVLPGPDDTRALHRRGSAMTLLALTIVAVFVAVAAPVAWVIGRALAAAPCESRPCDLCGTPICRAERPRCEVVHADTGTYVFRDGKRVR